MDIQRQIRYYDLGKDYWWLVGKYNVITKFLRDNYPIDEGSRRIRIIEVGCGLGNMLDRLSGFDGVYGSDYSVEALKFMKHRNNKLHTFCADLQFFPAIDNSFAIVLAIDVLEHLNDDTKAISEICRILQENGKLLLTVPAFNVLWGNHDVIFGHKRRYRVGEIKRMLHLNGFVIERISYFEPLFFIPLLIFRKIKKAIPCHNRDDFISIPKWLNKFLILLISSESVFLKKVRFPFGTTIICVARKCCKPVECDLIPCGVAQLEIMRL